MKLTVIILRIVLGLMLFAFGLSSLFELMELPKFSVPGQHFMDALISTGYMMPQIALFKIFVGLSLLSNRFVPLFLVIFFPISINMLLFHLFLDIKGIAGSLIIFLLNVILLFMHLNSYKLLLKSKT